jgi:hypothetical protein
MGSSWDYEKFIQNIGQKTRREDHLEAQDIGRIMMLKFTFGIKIVSI